MAEGAAPRRSDYKEEKEKEKDVRSSNIVAAKGTLSYTFRLWYIILTHCTAVADCIRTSLGPKVSNVKDVM